MNMEKIRNTFSDEAFLNALLELETAAEVQTALQEKGIEVTEEDVLAIRELVNKMESGELTQEQLAVLAQQLEDGELSEETLEQVSGGVAAAVVIGGAIGIAGLAACVFGIGVAVDNLVVRFTNRHW